MRLDLSQASKKFAVVTEQTGTQTAVIPEDDLSRQVTGDEDDLGVASVETKAVFVVNANSLHDDSIASSARILGRDMYEEQKEYVA